MTGPAAFLAGLVIAVSGALAQSTAPTARSPQAQEALARGFAMAQQQQWPLAIRYFRTAQQHAPTDGAVLFNLALANDKAGGRELLAAAWYQAFLAAQPDAQTAPQVKKRLVDIEIAAEIQLTRLLATAAQAAQQIPDRAVAAPALEQVARAQAEAGDLAGAQRSVAAIGNDSRAPWALAQIASADAHGGNPDRALTFAQTIKAAPAKSWALAEVAVAYAKRGDFARALKAAEGITIAYEQAWAWSRVAALQARSGDVAGARMLLERIPKDKSGPRAVALAAVAAAQAKIGLSWTGDSIKTMLAEAAAAADAVPTMAERAGALGQVARAHAVAGDGASAERALARIPDGPELYRAKFVVAEARGEADAAAIYRWTALAVRGDGDAQLVDLDGILRAAQAQPPAQAVAALAKAAEARARFLRGLRGQE